jgi:hypothetical protein
LHALESPVRRRVASTRAPEPAPLARASRRNVGFFAVVGVVALAMALGWIVATSRGGLPAPERGRATRVDPSAR